MIATQQEETDFRYYPMLAFEGESAKDELHAAWSVYRALPKETREVLISSMMPIKLRLLCETFRAKDADIIKVSSTIRELFFKKKSLDEAAMTIATLVSVDKAKVMEFIEKEVLTVRPDLEVIENNMEEPQTVGPTKDSLPLLAALGKYARLGEQMITREKIRVKSSPEPVRPNVVNWLKIYRDELGVGYHDPVRRAKFLFQSPSCKGLSSEERERLNLILRSIEENVPLDIDLGRMEIIFPSFNVVEGIPVRNTSRSDASEPARPVSSDALSSRTESRGLSRNSSAPSAKPAAGRSDMGMTPPMAPKRTDVPHISSSQSLSAEKQVSQKESGKEEAPSGFRMGRGMGFHSLKSYEVPQVSSKSPADVGQVSFSSKHAFPAEQGSLGIKKDLGGPLPSGLRFSEASFGSAKFGQASGSKGVAAGDGKRASLEKSNPFVIKPMNMIEREKSQNADKDVPGRIVDLRNEE